LVDEDREGRFDAGGRLASDGDVRDLDEDVVGREGTLSDWLMTAPAGAATVLLVRFAA
jgi:hypothetical protein